MFSVKTVPWTQLSDNISVDGTNREERRLKSYWSNPVVACTSQGRVAVKAKSVSQVDTQHGVEWLPAMRFDAEVEAAQAILVNGFAYHV